MSKSSKNIPEAPKKKSFSKFSTSGHLALVNRTKLAFQDTVTFRDCDEMNEYSTNENCIRRHTCREWQHADCTRKELAIIPAITVIVRAHCCMALYVFFSVTMFKSPNLSFQRLCKPVDIFLLYLTHCNVFPNRLITICK